MPRGVTQPKLIVEKRGRWDQLNGQYTLQQQQQQQLYFLITDIQFNLLLLLVASPSRHLQTTDFK
jgi:hypothetical protein